MSDLATMARPYCERLAASSERFTFDVLPKTDIWIFTDCLRHSPPDCHLITSTWVDMEVRLWAFFGPLLNEKSILILEARDSEDLLECVIRTAVEAFGG